MTTPLVSVVIPTYNRSQALQRALGGVRQQTCDDYEVIVVDDGSTDDTSDAVARLAPSFAPGALIYIRCEKNAGAAAARNRGIASARGEFIALLDADDEWLPAKLQTQVDFFKGLPPDVGLVTTRYAILDRDRQAVGEYPRTPREGDLSVAMIDMLSGCGEVVGVFSTVMFRRHVAEAIGGLDETLPCWHDADFYFRAAQQFKYAFIKDALTLKHEPADAISASWRTQVAGQRRFWQKYQPLLGERRQFRRYIAVHRHMLGRRACLTGEIRKGRRLFVESLAIFPSQWRPAVDLALSLAGGRAYASAWSARERLRRPVA